MPRAFAFSLIVLLLGLAPTTGAQGAAGGSPGPSPSALVVTDLLVGDGAEVVPRSAAIVHYTGWLYDPAAPDGKGRQFDSSRTRGVPLGFIVGAGKVIPGWEKGVLGMRKGGQRRLVIPPDLAYGAKGAGTAIPPGATLVFEIELVELKR